MFDLRFVYGILSALVVALVIYLTFSKGSRYSPPKPVSTEKKKPQAKVPSRQKAKKKEGR